MQDDNRQDGSLDIAITLLDTRKKANFCTVADHTDPNWDRVHIQLLEEDARGETSLGASLGNSGVIDSDVARY